MDNALDPDWVVEWPDKGNFCGATFDPDQDIPRLPTQMERFFVFMRDGKWHTSAEIAHAVGEEWASLSARWRDLKRPEWGHYGHEERRVREGHGLWEYRLGQKYAGAIKAKKKTKTETARADEAEAMVLSLLDLLEEYEPQTVRIIKRQLSYA